LVECATANVDTGLADPHCSLVKIDVIPTQARDFTAPQARESEVPGMPVAVLRDAAEDCADLIGGECLEFSGLARYAIDQSGNISRQAALGDQLREDLR